MQVLINLNFKELNILQSTGSESLFCTVSIRKTEYRSKVVAKNNEPKWNQVFTFYLTSLEEKLKIKLKDWARYKKDKLGSVHVSRIFG